MYSGANPRVGTSPTMLSRNNFRTLGTGRCRTGCWPFSGRDWQVSGSVRYLDAAIRSHAMLGSEQHLPKEFVDS